MTQEEKNLLLKDLCARLTYGVKCTTKSMWNGIYTIVGYKDNRVFLDCPIYEEGDDEWMIESIVPYLRPMSSMTKEERKEYKHLVAFSGSPEGAVNFVDWLNKKMFAYRTINGKDMFELGIALKAPEGMYEKAW